MVDLILGNLLGIAFLFQIGRASLWVSNFTAGITNYLLRTGCVWLMANPAGFKLNTELAGILGMMSLNAIQIWSTIWFTMGFLLVYLIRMLAVSGILFGLTTSASLMIDVISLVTMHVSTLHWLLSMLYSWQIQAIAALWRLFQGRKWNPLRQRLDSYDYTVEQHVVGSLIFTPLLLLLPTTSVFYIFFTILKVAINLICIVIEVTISIVHVTPYYKILLWLLRRKRFPSGIWFEIISCEQNVNGASLVGSSCEDNSPSPNLVAMSSRSGKATVLVSFLHSNHLSIGEIIWPCYEPIFSVFSGSSAASAVYSVLTGKSIQSALGTFLPPSLPWMAIPCKDYWLLCYNSVLACKKDFCWHSL